VAVKAVVLAGGEGTRLRPLTFSTPKQMLPVAGRPVIERVVEELARHGVDEVVLSLGYRPDAFTAAYPEGRCAGTALRYAVEDTPLDTAGAIGFAARQGGVGDDTFIAMNADVLAEIDVTALVEFHRSRGAQATIALTPVEDPSLFGVVAVDATGKVESFIEKPGAQEAPTNLINAGVYVLEPSFLDLIPEGGRVSVEREVFPALVEQGALYALGSDALWTDMGTPVKYLEANLAWARREGAISGGGPRTHPEAEVVDSVVHQDVTIEKGAVVREAVVLEGAHVREGAFVNRSVLGRKVVVGPGAVVDALSVLGDGWVVAAGTVLEGARLPASP
jgi:mannose-1-phosphate guanylyltransferase